MMNPALKLILAMFALLMTAQQVAAEEWRGLRPLSSTRADVVRLFGECSQAERWCEFTLDNEDIFIEFSSAQTCDGVPPGTVLSIQRELRNVTTIEHMRENKRQFKSFDPSLPKNKGYRGFIDDESGLLFKTDRGQVFQINYIAAKKDRQICRDYYRNPRQFVEVVWPHVFVVDSVVCPQTSPVDGEKVVIKANYERTGQRFLLTWRATGGQILEGDGTGKILFDTTGLGGKTVTVTVELNDGEYHTATGSCSLTVSPKTKN